MPRSQIDDNTIIISHNQRYSRTSKRAVQRGEEKTKNKEEEEEPARSQDDRRPGPAHFLDAAYTAHTGTEQQPDQIFFCDPVILESICYRTRANRLINETK